MGFPTTSSHHKSLFFLTASEDLMKMSASALVLSSVIWVLMWPPRDFPQGNLLLQYLHTYFLSSIGLDWRDVNLTQKPDIPNKVCHKPQICKDNIAFNPWSCFQPHPKRWKKERTEKRKGQNWDHQVACFLTRWWWWWWSEENQNGQMWQFHKYKIQPTKRGETPYFPFPYRMLKI